MPLRIGLQFEVELALGKIEARQRATPSPATSQSPDFAAWMTFCTSLPMRGPSARALTRELAGDAELDEAVLREAAHGRTS